MSNHVAPSRPGGPTRCGRDRDRSRPARATAPPWAWWGWALCASAAVSLTTNPLVIGLIVASVVAVVLLRRTDAPWARSLKIYLVLALVIVGMRLFFQLTIGGVRTGTVLFTLPSIELPAWAAGVTLGGPVTVDAIAVAMFDAIRLAAMLLCVGAANSLANPRTALKSVPAALRDISTAVVIALALIPQLIASIHRVRRGQRLRGGRRRGLGALPGTLMPVIEDAVEGSLQLATSMESRGYGRTRGADRGRKGTWQLLCALLAVLFGSYVLLAVPPPGRARWGSRRRSGSPSACSRPVSCSRPGPALLRPADGCHPVPPAPWGVPETLTLACGAVALGIIGWLISRFGVPAEMNANQIPVRWPTLPPLAVLAAVALAVPGFATPPRGGPDDRVRPRHAHPAGRRGTHPPRRHRPHP
ncbi:energy-coupling factor transporter transmembrane protein EcfT [Tessaracoccus sp. HDW20]|nr:energy-coupling factor transporter transmembrane protein EcfT [Tessaracoccus coleopterorum]